MPETTYKVPIGDIKCVVIDDGYLPDPEGNYGLNIIYIESQGRKILIDNGGGWVIPETAGRLLANMKNAGIKPGDITDIIFDHAHIDHVCGTFDKRGKPVFSGARYIIDKKEWAYVTAGPGDNEIQNNLFTHARQYLVPLKERFIIVDSGYQVVPGVKMVPAVGHTPGNVMVEITSRGKTLLCVGDIIHSLKEFTNSEQCAAFDVTPEQAIKTREAILARESKQGTFIFATHFTFPGLGYFREKKGVFSWEPI